MIVSLEGKLIEAAPLSAVIEANGIGYEVFIPVTTAEKLPGIGQTARLHTLAVYREDSQTLYGFATREDRDFFRLLVEKVSGIGPKIALNIMSRMSVESLRTRHRPFRRRPALQMPGYRQKKPPNVSSSSCGTKSSPAESLPRARPALLLPASAAPAAPPARPSKTPSPPWSRSAISRPKPTRPCVRPRTSSAPTLPPRPSSRPPSADSGETHATQSRGADSSAGFPSAP